MGRGMKKDDCFRRLAHWENEEVRMEKDLFGGKDLLVPDDQTALFQALCISVIRHCCLK